MRWTALDADATRSRHRLAMQQCRLGGSASSTPTRVVRGADAEHGGGRPRRPHRRRLAGSRAGAQARATTCTAWCRRRAGTHATTGPAGCPPTRPRARPTPSAAGSPPPTSASPRRTIRTTSPANGRLPYRQQRIEQTAAGAAQARDRRPGGHAGRRESLAALVAAALAAEGGVGAPAGRGGAHATAGLRRHHGRRPRRAAHPLGLAAATRPRHLPGRRRQRAVGTLAGHAHLPGCAGRRARPRRHRAGATTAARRQWKPAPCRAARR